MKRNSLVAVENWSLVLQFSKSLPFFIFYNKLKKNQGYLISLFNNKLVIIWRIVCYYSLYGYPVEFPDDCEVVMFGCEKRAVKKHDHTIECKVTAMIG